MLNMINRLRGVALAVIFSAVPVAAFAVTIAVNDAGDTLADDGKCTLREATIAANNNIATGATAGECAAGEAAPTVDRIEVPANTYLLTLIGADDMSAVGDLDITEDVAIVGAGAGLTLIDGGGQGGLGDRIIHLGGAAALTIEEVTLRGGTTGESGGGVLTTSTGALTIRRCIVTENISGAGGGLYADGSGMVTIDGSTIADNQTQLDIFPPHGGGIYNLGRMTITDSAIVGNTAEQHGGGIVNANGDMTLTVKNSTIANNTAGVNHEGGGFYQPGSKATLTNVTITGNTAGNGGGLVANGGTVTVKNSILAGNTGGSNPDCLGAANIVSSGHNLVLNAEACSGAFAATGDKLNEATAGLGAFLSDADAGESHTPLTKDSPAIDAADAATCVNALARDQLDMARYGTCDMGAVEFQGACGDGFKQASVEACDDGNTAGGDGCSADCKKVETCGDAVVDTGEACDDGNTTDGDGCDHLCKEEVAADESAGDGTGDDAGNGDSTGTGETTDDGDDSSDDGAAADGADASESANDDGSSGCALLGKTSGAASWSGLLVAAALFGIGLLRGFRRGKFHLPAHAGDL